MKEKMKVTTQAELDAALAADEVREIIIHSTAGVWLTLGATSDKRVIVDVGGTVQEVWSGGTVQEVWSGGTVQEVWSGGTVQKVWSGGVLHLYGGTVTKAAPLAALMVHRASVIVEGGQVIDLTTLDEANRDDWLDLNGVEVRNGEAILYKAVNDDLKSQRGFDYPIGETVESPDWVDANDCGGGLHFSPTPLTARSYFIGATRFLEVAVPVEGLRPITGGNPKAKSKTARVLREVNTAGEAVSGEGVKK